MSDWMSWLVVAGIAVMIELYTGTFYLLMIAIGMAAGALAAFLGVGKEFQLIIAAIVGVLATVTLRRSRFGLRNKVSASRDPNVNLDIGQLIQINEWQSIAPDLHTARAMYRGALWDVEFFGHAEPKSGMFKIVEIRGSQLVVEMQ
ncbi:NfeD family protein [Solimicrobium silvestre]|uniref:Membrane protein implicated in regulation of membrane protease activity n=1 Tax=Solimicrobium silvestre TaxID=2099400 RepID=A0A2S9GSH0_9BURK|nr:NfeD family protein [Solimicrobium silvestre]PRC90669.1 hypothetical protein S2091_4619 [Solimicrobium silvestre]